MLDESGRLCAERKFDWEWDDVAGFAAHLKRQGLALNVAHLAGHGSIRLSVMGSDSGEPSAEQLRAMQCDGRARDGRWRGRTLVRARLFSRDDREAGRAGRARARRRGGGRRADLASARILGALVVLRQPDSAQHPGRARDGQRRARGGRPAASLASDFCRTAHVEDGRRHDRRSRASQERRRRYRVRHFPLHLRQHDDSRDFSGVGADWTRRFARFVRRMDEIARRIPAAQVVYRRLGSADVGGQARAQPSRRQVLRTRSPTS